MTIEAYPLQWPSGWKTTAAHNRTAGKFKASFAVARDELLRELRLMLTYSEGKQIVISSNVPLRQDGKAYASFARHSTRDGPGVAVYFQRDGKPLVMACDRFMTVEANTRAVGKSIEALRGLRRWGATELLERTFTGFEQLPPPPKPPVRDPWWLVLDVLTTASIQECRMRRIELAKKFHPDSGTHPDASRMATINAAVDARERL